MKILNELAELSKKANVAGQGSPEMVDFRVTANPDNILAIAEAFRAQEREVKHQLNVTTLISKQHNRTVVERDDWKQRAEAAEAKLAELAKQKPIGAFHIRDQDVEATSDYVDPGQWPVDNGVIEVFTRAAPATDLAELVPDELTWSYHDNITQGEVSSWNDCRAATLRNIEEAK